MDTRGGDIRICMQKIPHTFVSCKCIEFRLYAKLLSSKEPILAYCAVFLNKSVKLVLNCVSILICYFLSAL